jgi:hypothetical protein
VIDPDTEPCDVMVTAGAPAKTTEAVAGDVVICMRQLESSHIFVGMKYVTVPVSEPTVAAAAMPVGVPENVPVVGTPTVPEITLHVAELKEGTDSVPLAVAPEILPAAGMVTVPVSPLQVAELKDGTSRVPLAVAPEMLPAVGMLTVPVRLLQIGRAHV